MESGRCAARPEVAALYATQHISSVRKLLNLYPSHHASAQGLQNHTLVHCIAHNNKCTALRKSASAFVYPKNCSSNILRGKFYSQDSLLEIDSTSCRLKYGVAPEAEGPCVCDGLAWAVWTVWPLLSTSWAKRVEGRDDPWDTSLCITKAVGSGGFNPLNCLQIA